MHLHVLGILFVHICMEDVFTEQPTTALKIFIINPGPSDITATFSMNTAIPGSQVRLPFKKDFAVCVVSTPPIFKGGIDGKQGEEAVFD